MDTKTKDMIRGVEAKANQAAQEWIKKTEPHIERHVHELLNAHVQEVVSKLLGFDNSYGEPWKLDHCNGRAGESAAGDWLRKRVGQAVYDWLDQQAQKLPSLPDKTAKSLREQYSRSLENETHRLLHQKAMADAQAEIERVCTDWIVHQED